MSRDGDRGVGGTHGTGRMQPRIQGIRSQVWYTHVPRSLSCFLGIYSVPPTLVTPPLSLWRASLLWYKAMTPESLKGEEKENDRDDAVQLGFGTLHGRKPGCFLQQLAANLTPVPNSTACRKTKARGGEGKGRRWMAGLWMDGHLLPSSLKHQEQNQGKARQGPDNATTTT
ncbi:hypothetical protein BDP55DRAFT_711052 [Colletotrichum godetiae]|uniref:Uncharacterized protein n=1 Tax=Colletotrichum godetiae TaxID=1209918 RepID=A0AAJ0AW17_9PEZI|nr:uncharacterized protein BDP55DRAFT_711052 [Colletotrichum godetiae]KAK1691431.1 hypothetical protein BDP55DRAFT_711052 [Colletotrichum godetiae]